LCDAEYISENIQVEFQENVGSNTKLKASFFVAFIKHRALI